ncbi:MAG: class I SAM-dependent methyltransferase, partial [Vicinamibacteria bacterium]
MFAIIPAVVASNPDSDSAEAEQRYEREREFHDDRFTEDHRSANRFYPLMKAADAYFGERIDGVPADAAFLEYGCGADAYTSIHLAERGRRVVGVDLSEVAIAKAEAKVRSLGLDELVDLRVMNAEALDLADQSFDVICGVGVIHHLKLERAFSEVARVL